MIASNKPLSIYKKRSWTHLHLHLSLCSHLQSLHHCLHQTHRLPLHSHRCLQGASFPEEESWVRTLRTEHHTPAIHQLYCTHHGLAAKAQDWNPESWWFKPCCSHNKVRTAVENCNSLWMKASAKNVKYMKVQLNHNYCSLNQQVISRWMLHILVVTIYFPSL